jgi:hypothetical protein
MDFRESRPKFLFPQFFSTMAEISHGHLLQEYANGNNPFSSMLWFSLDSSLVNGQQIICTKVADTRNSAF